MSEGNIQESYNQCKKSLEIFPEFNRGKELMKTLENHLSII